MARLNGETLQIEGSVDSWDGDESLANAERVADETFREYQLFCAGAGDLADRTSSDDRPSVEIGLWNAYMRALSKVRRLRDEYDLHADRSEASRHDAEVEAQAEAAQA